MIYKFIFVNKIKLTVLTLKNFMKLKFFYLIIEMSIHDIFAPSISVKVSTKRLSCDYNHLLHVWLTITKTIWYAMAGHVTKSKSYSFTPFYIRQYHQLIVVQPIKLGKTTKIFHSKKYLACAGLLQFPTTVVWVKYILVGLIQSMSVTWQFSYWNIQYLTELKVVILMQKISEWSSNNKYWKWNRPLEF